MVSPSEKTAYIALGSNLGPRARNISSALALLEHSPFISVICHSRLIETSPVGGPAQQDNYLNAAAQLRSRYRPEELLGFLLKVEKQLGRTRTQKWAPRTIDLDLLLFDQQIIDQPYLKVPHPLMHQRIFVMQPLAEIAPDIVHPILKKTNLQILEDLLENDNI